MLVAIPVDITSSALGLKIFAITGGTKNYESIIKKKKKKHDKIVLIAKIKLNRIIFKDVLSPPDLARVAPVAKVSNRKQ